MRWCHEGVLMVCRPDRMFRAIRHHAASPPGVLQRERAHGDGMPTEWMCCRSVAGPLGEGRREDARLGQELHHARDHLGDHEHGDRLQHVLLGGVGGVAGGKLPGVQVALRLHVRLDGAQFLGREAGPVRQVESRFAAAEGGEHDALPHGSCLVLDPAGAELVGDEQGPGVARADVQADELPARCQADVDHHGHDGRQHVEGGVQVADARAVLLEQVAESPPLALQPRVLLPGVVDGRARLAEVVLEPLGEVQEVQERLLPGVVRGLVVLLGRREPALLARHPLPVAEQSGLPQLLREDPGATGGVARTLAEVSVLGVGHGNLPV